MTVEGNFSVDEEEKKRDWKRQIRKRRSLFTPKMIKQSYYAFLSPEEPYRLITEYYISFRSRKQHYCPPIRRYITCSESVAPYLTGEIDLPHRVYQKLSSYVKSKNEENKKNWKILPEEPVEENVKFPLMFIIFQDEFYEIIEEETSSSGERRYITEHVGTQDSASFGISSLVFQECHVFDSLLIVPSYITLE